MKILYGVQGTGNGHISRARMLASYLNDSDIDVSYLFTGRARQDFFDMEIFGDFMHRRGLTFHSENGKVSYPKTLLQNNIFQFIAEVMSLNVKEYDAIITDFEPVCAWAGKLKHIPVIGLGHQYAFGHNIPRAGEDPLAKMIMKYFAPASLALGLHWHHFDNAILPPIIDTSIKRKTSDQPQKIVVYLPFENQTTIQQLFEALSDFQFVIYSPDLVDRDIGHISLRKTCHDGFKRDLISSKGVICNSGFELISECLHLGLPVLTKPQYGQMEQLSNAAALRELGYAKTVDELNSQAIQQWLSHLPVREPMVFPDVAKHIVQWLASGQRENAATLSKTLWTQAVD